MSLGARLFAALAVVGLLPVALTGSVTYAVNRDEIAKTVGRSQEVIAAEAARGCERYLANAIESVRSSVSMLPIAQLSRAEIGAVLRIPYAQLGFVRGLAVFGARGELLAPPIYGAAGADPGGRQPAVSGELEHFLAVAPSRLALEAGTAMSSPYRAAGGEPRVAVALGIGSGHVVAAELSLADVARDLREIAGGSEAFLVTAGGEVLAGGKAALTDGERSLLADARNPLTRIVRSSDGRELLASAAPLAQLGWLAMVTQPASDAFRAAGRVRLYTAFWGVVSLLLIAVLGLGLSRSLSGPVRQLARAADTMGEGRYDISLDIQGGDEIGRLASAFRRMAASVQRRDEEIRGWNTELQQRVDQRTAELKAAQDQILRTRRLAALGALGAGLSHELNSPLTAITGLLSLLRMQAGKDSAYAPIVQQVIDQAMRAAKIVDGVRRFTESERSGGVPFNLDKAVRAVLGARAEQMQKRHIRVTSELPAARAVQGDPQQIEQVVDHLIRNAIEAMPLGGDLRVQLSDLGGDALKLTVTDTGRGIPAEIRERIFDPFFTTKPDGNQVGLGLSISHTIVEAHHGRLLVDSAEGRGSTFTVFLPAAVAAAHLA